MKWIYLLIFPLCLLSSCIEIIDDLKFNADGSGTFKYTVNLSSSKVKINSLLALDSLDGKKVPDLADIRAKINAVEKSLSEKAGISNVKSEQNYNDFIFRIECDFEIAKDLQNALKDIIGEESKNTKLDFLQEDWLNLTNEKLVRNIPEISVDNKRSIKAEDIELLKKGSYVCITRFDKAVERSENEAAKISPNKLNVMVRTNVYSLIENPSLLENTIYFTNKRQ